MGFGMKNRKVPVILQTESMECGCACLAMILAYYKKWIPVEQLRSDCASTRNGISAKTLVEVARTYGLRAGGKRYSIEQLQKKAVLPCILFWNFSHYIVLTGFRRGKAQAIDPDSGEVELSEDEMRKSYTGICLEMEPGEDFRPEGTRPSLVNFAARHLAQFSRPFIFTLILLAVSGLFEFINPVFSKVFLDVFLHGYSSNAFYAFITVLGILCAANAAVGIVAALESKKIDGTLAVRGSADYMWSLLHLPLDYFQNRGTGDIISRKEDHAGITGTFINTIAPLFVNALLAIFYIAVMLRFSPLLTALGLAGILLNTICITASGRKRKNLTRILMKEKARRSSHAVAGIDMIESIKAGGAENVFFNNWTDIHTKENNTIIKMIRLNTLWGTLSEHLTILMNCAILFLGAWLVMKGQFTMGAVLGIQLLVNGLSRPVEKTLESQQLLQETRVTMERISDMENYPEDILFAQEEREKDSIPHGPLSGALELKNVTFGYSRSMDPTIHDFSMKLEPGKSVAIVGPSGSGKSTVGALISGLHTPWEGEILFDGKAITDLDRVAFRSSFAVVEQSVSLFPGSVRDNIKMFDETLSEEDMISASRDAVLHDDIMKRKGGYDYIIQKDAEDFSGGQRQKLELARAFAQNPAILLLDEATSSLDGWTEELVMQSIKNRGCSCIIIAHRLSTIRRADEIIVLDRGCIIDRGTHEELMERCEVYRNMISRN